MTVVAQSSVAQKIIRPNVFRPTGFSPNRLHPTLQTIGSDVIRLTTLLHAIKRNRKHNTIIIKVNMEPLTLVYVFAFHVYWHPPFFLRNEYWKNRNVPNWQRNKITAKIRYDTIAEFNVDWKAEYSALSSTRSQKKKLKQSTPVPL